MADSDNAQLMWGEILGVVILFLIKYKLNNYNCPSSSSWSNFCKKIYNSIFFVVLALFWGALFLEKHSDHSFMSYSFWGGMSTMLLKEFWPKGSVKPIFKDFIKIVFIIVLAYLNYALGTTLLTLMLWTFLLPIISVKTNGSLSYGYKLMAIIVLILLSIPSIINKCLMITDIRIIQIVCFVVCYGFMTLPFMNIKCLKPSVCDPEPPAAETPDSAISINAENCAPDQVVVQM